VTKRTPARPQKEAESAPQSGKTLAKSADPAFTKFTIYIRKTTHRAAKVRMVSEDRELSDLVEELLTVWLKENDSNGR
jgi:hypothetical protein